jgi:hypothetical protein
VLFNRDSTIHKCFRKSALCTSQRRISSVPSRPDARQTKHHPSRQRVFPSGPFTVSRSFYSSLHPSGRPSGRPSVFDQASGSFQNYIWEDCCNRPDDSAAHPDALQYSIKLLILSKIIYRKIAATVRTTWISVRTRFSLRQESQFKFNRPDVCQHGPDARTVNMEITC